MPPHLTLALAALLWFGIHKGVAGSPLRAAFVSRFGEGAFRGFFSLLSLASLSFLIHAYRRAPCDPLWVTPRWLLALPLLVMPIAFVLVVGAFSTPNPTSVGGERALGREDPARGAQRITRHPFLWGVILWSGAHSIVNGNVPALLFFGTMLLTGLAGTRDIDRKRARSAGSSWEAYAAVTSNLPFAAIAAGRNRLVLRELAVPLGVGLLLFALVLHFHSALFGLSALRAFG